MTRTEASIETRKARSRAAAVAIAPAVMLAGFLSHPYFTTLPDSAQLAEAVAADTTRWGVAHLAVAVGSGVMILAFLALRSEQWAPRRHPRTPYPSPLTRPPGAGGERSKQ